MALNTGQKAFVATGVLVGLAFVAGAIHYSAKPLPDEYVEALPKTAPLDAAPSPSAQLTPVAADTDTSIEISHSGSLEDLDQVISLGGKCTLLRFGGQDLTDGCQPSIVNSVYRSGRSGFTFTLGDLAVLTISGAGENIKSETEITQPVDMTIWSMLEPGAKPITRAAVGSCTFGDPYRGRSTLACRGKSASGEFAATFITDGRPPKTAHIGN